MRRNRAEKDGRTEGKMGQDGRGRIEMRTKSEPGRDRTIVRNRVVPDWTTDGADGWKNTGRNSKGRDRTGLSRRERK